MKKYLKYAFYFFLYLLIVLFMAVMFIVTTADAKILKPNNSIEPSQVVKIQLNGLKNNDKPSKDFGIEQTWEFAHPNNQKYTGPIEKFKSMLKGENFSVLLNHIDHKITEKYLSENVAVYEVVILDIKKKYYKFKWQVEKYTIDGPLKNCWLTTAVSNPMPSGSSI
jgi:hypothetical protein|tara:strand:- start:4356 stop:4853 length:498 start_codon:yes stop_codon:yes gene_type:complete